MAELRTPTTREILSLFLSRLRCCSRRALASSGGNPLLFDRNFLRTYIRIYRGFQRVSFFFRNGFLFLLLFSSSSKGCAFSLATKRGYRRIFLFFFVKKTFVERCGWLFMGGGGGRGKRRMKRRLGEASVG